jgi:cell fate regulator YaaT (PSP1 superfamily)
VTDTAVATHLVEVEFKGNRRVFFQFQAEQAPALKSAVIVTVDRGEDLGRVHSIGELADKRKAGTAHGKASPEQLPPVVRVATPQEVDRAVRLRADEHAVRKAAIEFSRELKLDLKISDTEWQWDRRKLTIFFTAEERVDFRELVRRLEKRFSTRVHMWHIGVRDEARRLDGIGRCGRQFCSASWLPELRPVKSSTAKDQRLSTLNPAQISGTCGRLMCCLRHEHEFYVQQRKRFPKEGKIITTAAGEEKIVSNDIFRDLVTLRTAEGEYRTIPLADLRKETAPGIVPPETLAAGSLVELKRAAHDHDHEHDHEDDSHLHDHDDEHVEEEHHSMMHQVHHPEPQDDTALDEDTSDPSAKPRSGPSGEPRSAPSGEPRSSPSNEPRSGPSGEPRSGASAAPTGPESAADAEHRKRRRRGRRGGRRGRGDTGGNGGGAGSGGDAAPPSKS